MVLSDGNFLLQRRIKKLSPELQEKYLGTAFVMTGMLDKVEALFPDFTDHTARHALIVLDFIDRLIGEENAGKMNADEIYLLLCSCYLHDIGMTIGEETFRKLKARVLPEHYEAEHPEMKLRDLIREFHQEFSAVMIFDHEELFELPSHEYAFCLAQIARGHRRTPIDDPAGYDPAYALPNGNRVCLPYLSALIRLADELDIAIDRNPISSYGEQPDTLSFRQHFAVKHLIMEDTGFTMQIETEEEEVREACLRAGRKLKATLAYCYRVINELTPFKMTQSRFTVFLNGKLLESTELSGKSLSVLDTDAGIDDLMALSLTSLMGEKGPDYVLVSPGNTDLGHAVRNVALIRKQLGLRFVIVRGENAAQPATEKDSFHGADGMGNLSDRVAERLGFSEKDTEDVISFTEFRRRLLLCESISYTTIGPLNGLIRLLGEPEISGRLREIYTMGGGLSEWNCRYGTEFNFAKSPEAVRTLLSSGKNITLFPLDITNHHLFTEEDLQAFRDNAFFPELYELLSFNLRANALYNHIPAAVLHDMVPLLYQLSPEKYETRELRLLSDAHGKTYEDPAGYPVRVVLSGPDGIWAAKKIFRVPERP